MNIFYPFQLLAYFLTDTVFHLKGHIGEAVNFFIYDSLKIILLLIVMIQIMSLVNIIFPIEKIRDFLTQKKLYGLEYIFASFFGAMTPFCTCSSIPLFIGFLKGGIPLGVTLSFLITSPLVNEIAIAMLLGVFGLKITLIYVFSGILLGVVGGFVLEKLHLEKYIADFVLKIRDTSGHEEVINIQTTWKEKFQISSKEGWTITKKIVPYILLGVGVGGLIHGFVPTGFFENSLSEDNLFAVPIAVIVGIPMYANATSIIPIIQALIVKGVPLGTGLAFMMAVVGLSLPEFLILKKIMKLPLLCIYFGVIGLFIIILGYFYNIIL